MFRARITVFVLGFCCSISALALGQNPVAELTQRIDPAAAYLNPLQTNQWIGLNADRSISGKLVTFDGASEVLPRRAVAVSLVQRGKTISQVMTDADGEFQFKDIAPGIYNFVAASEYCFATYAIHVLPSGSGSPSSFEACAATIPSAQALELIKESWVPSESYNAKRFDKDPLGEKRVVSTSSRVLLQNGDLHGQVSRPGLPISEQDLTGNVAHVFKAGQSVAAAPVGRDGKFRIVNLEPGAYDLAVVGEDGNAVVGFEAVGPKPIAIDQSGDSGHRLVSFQDLGNSLNVELAVPSVPGSEEVPPPVEDTVVLDQGFGQPFMGGGFAAPGGFGGGFGGGGVGGGGVGGGGRVGGGIGGLLGIAGLAVGIAALSSNDDFNPGLATIITP